MRESVEILHTPFTKKVDLWADKFLTDDLGGFHVWLYCRTNKFNKNKKYSNEQFDLNQLIGLTKFASVCI